MMAIVLACAFHVHGASRSALVRSSALSASRAPAPARVCASMGLLETLAEKVSQPLGGERSEFSVERNAAEIERYLARVARVNALEPEIEALDANGMRARVDALRRRVQSGEVTLDGVQDETFALVREAAWRALGLRHYDVQMVGGMALADGRLAEMATGEGKTLVATLPITLHALTGKGAHVVTCSEYLARRDAEIMGQVYALLGLSVGIVGIGESVEAKRAAYRCDITYVTNSELGFDYLRDNLATDLGRTVLRELNFCVVDEADSILIDEARTPIIIADSTSADTAKVGSAAQIARALQRTVHYEVDDKEKLVTLTADGTTVAGKLLGVDSIFSAATPWAPYIVNALKAKELYKKDVSYVLQGSSVQIVDEFTGRVLDGRRWGDGLQQAVEAKEGLPTSNVSQVVATVTYQSLFKLYARMAGMSGTATQESAEFESIYGTKVVQVPTAAPIARRDYADVIFVNKEGKVRAFVDEVARMHKTGRPVLVGTASIADSEALSAALAAAAIPHEVLNARADKATRESLVVAQAGRLGAVTIATNMAGRGTDILLGGNAGALARVWLRAQLAPDAAASLDEQLGGVALPAQPSERATALAAAAAAAAAAERAAAPAAAAGASAASELDLKLARAASDVPLAPGSAEAAMREALEAVRSEFALALVAEREEVVRLGGLHVVGTQRHESRRIDAQLRGRAGRQGDPGSSRFILSVDDDVFRIFGGERVKAIFSTMRLSEDTPIESKQVTETLDGVQKRVEGYYRYIRSQLFNYDMVSAAQRKQLYKLRRQVLEADAAAALELLAQQCDVTAEGIIAEANKAAGKPDAAAATAKLAQFFGGPSVFALTPADLDGERGMLSVDAAKAAARAALAAKAKALEGKRADLAAATARYLLLVQLDALWKKHLSDVRNVQDMVGLRSIGNRDPLIEFREEASDLYARMLKVAAYNSVFSYFSYAP